MSASRPPPTIEDFTISANAERKLRSPSVSSTSGSQTTARGCQNTPARFLPRRRLTAVFPPTALSTMASRVVGTTSQAMPRMYVAATSPATSPTLPPPTATMQSSRSRPASLQCSRSRPATVHCLACSPPAMGTTRHSQALVSQPDGHGIGDGGHGLVGDHHHTARRRRNVSADAVEGARADADQVGMGGADAHRACECHGDAVGHLLRGSPTGGDVELGGAVRGRARHAEVAQRGLGFAPEQGPPTAVGAHPPGQLGVAGVKADHGGAALDELHCAVLHQQPPARCDHQRLRGGQAPPRRRAAPRRESVAHPTRRRRGPRPSQGGRPRPRRCRRSRARAAAPAEAPRWSCRCRGGRRAPPGRGRSPQRPRVSR